MYNIYKCEKFIREKEYELNKSLKDNDVNAAQKRRTKWDELAEKYRVRMTDFVTTMA